MNDVKTPILKFGKKTPIPIMIVIKITERTFTPNNIKSHSPTVQILTIP